MGNISRPARKFLLKKIAKKTNTYGINGKHNRKSLEKILNKATQRHNELKSGLDVAEKEYNRLDEYLGSTRKELMDARKDIMQCHDLMRNMDFANAHQVRVGRDEDIAYNCDGKWVHYNAENGDKEPFAAWRKSQTIDIEDANDSSEGEETENKMDPDGVDVDLS